MFFTQVCIVVVAVVGYTTAAGYGGSGGGYGGNRGGGSGGFGGGAGGGGYGGEAGGGYGGGAGGGYGGGAGGGYGGGAGGGYGGGQNYPKKPYNFNYQAADEQGNRHYREEQADASGTVRGSYGYTDQQGLFRMVEYIADANGFRAQVKTNEPGTDGKENPAHVEMNAVQPPAGVQERYTKTGGYGNYGGGASNFGGGSSGYRQGSGGSGGFGGAGFRAGKSGY